MKIKNNHITCLLFLVLECVVISGCVTNKSFLESYSSDINSLSDSFCLEESNEPKNTSHSDYLTNPTSSESSNLSSYDSTRSELSFEAPNKIPDLHSLSEITDVFYWQSLSSFKQDGCIFGNKLFLFNSDGVCSVFNLLNNELICLSQLPSYYGLLPHSNSVCFGPKYCESDSYPLIYTNVYNNYPNNQETYGMCFVYRIVDDVNFEFDLIQVIKIGFTDNVLVWFNGSENIRPYGNFLVDGNDLWVYLNIFGSNITRFFRFKLPNIASNNEFNFVLLLLDDVLEMFDTHLFKYIQGGIIYNHFLLSLEGFGNEMYPGFLRSVNLLTREVSSLNLNNLIGCYEPESIDFYNNVLVIGTNQGDFFYLN